MKILHPRGRGSNKLNQFSAAIRYVHVSPERETDTSCHLSVKCQVTIFLDSYYCVELVDQFFGYFVNFVDVVVEIIAIATSSFY